MKRRKSVASGAAALAAACLLLTACGGSPPKPPAPSPPPSPPASMAIQGHMLCVAAGGSLPFLKPAALAGEMRRIKQRGHASCIRFDIDRSVVEVAPGQFDWAPIDRVVHTAKANGLQILGILDGTPNWARPASCPAAHFAMCLPTWKDFGPFVRAAVAQYEPHAGSPIGIRYWEAWNEENSTGFGGPALSARAYVSLLRPLYVTIHHLEPGATVILGGLGPSDNSHGNMAPVTFLSQVYALGGRGYFDAVGDHPYSYPVPATYRQPWNAWQQLFQLRAVMVAHRDAAKQIWPTEFGAPTGGPGKAAAVGNYRLGRHPVYVTQPLQQFIMKNAFESWLTQWWLGPMFWYSFQDDATQTGIERHFGIMTAGNHPTAKPALSTFIKEELALAS